MITKFGKRFLTDFIAGNSTFATKDLAFGISSTAATENDTRLGFEFYRVPVTLSSIDIQDDGVGGFNYYAIYKTTVPQDVSGVISEIGLYPGVRTSLNFYDSKFVTSFENNIIWTDSLGDSPALESNSSDGTTFVSKIGENMVRFNVNASTSKEYKNSIVLLDLSGYSVNDTLALAYKKADNNTSKIRVKFYSSDTAYYYADFTPSGANGDKIDSVSMSAVFNNIVGSPDLTNITKIGIEVTAGSAGATVVYFDGLRVNDEDTFDPQYGLIARSILSTPLQKPSGRPVDVEYKLQLEF